MSSSTNNSIPFVPENTIDPAAGLNESINTIDALLQLAVLTVNTDIAPSSPAEGDRHIVGIAPSGAWAGQAGKVARFLDGYWVFYDANWALCKADSIVYARTGSAWAGIQGGQTLEIKDEGVTKGKPTALNFVGAGVTAAPDGAGGVIVTIPGGGGSGGGMDNPMTAINQMIVGGAGGAPTVLAAPTAAGFVLTFLAGSIQWAAGLLNPMTAQGDLIIGGTAGAAIRLAPGANGYVLTMAGGVPVWAAPTGGGGGAVNWGAIGGSILDQVDLATALGNLSTSKLDKTATAVAAKKLETARKINGVDFDGTADISIVDSSKLPIAGGALSGALNHAPIVTVASAATTNIGAAASNTVTVTGTATITSLGTIASGATRTVVFSGILTLTHNAASLILPTAANIITVAGDVAQFFSLGSGNWRCTGYMRASGAALSGSAGSAAWGGIGGTLSDQADLEGALASKAAKGVNSDITQLNGLTTPLSESQGGTGSAAGVPVMVGATASVAGTKGLVPPPPAGAVKFLGTDGEYHAAGGGGPILGSLVAWPLSEATIGDGLIVGSGQELLRATYPELWAKVSGQAIDDSAWLAAPYLERGKFSKGNGTTTFRMADPNAKYPDGNTPAAAFLRGYGKNSAGTPGLFQLAQMQGHGHSTATGIYVYTGTQSSNTGPATGSNTIGGPNQNTPNTNWVSGVIADGVNGTPLVGSETRPTDLTVIWCYVGASTTSNPGTVDVVSLASQVALNASKINTLEAAAKRYASPKQAITLGGAITLNHSLGGSPFSYQAFAVCEAAQGGYTVGQEVPINLQADHSGSAAAYGLSCIPSPTTLSLRVGTSGFAAFMINPTSGASFTPTAANWSIIVRATL